MTDDERATYALAQRENCRPMECSLDALCWVAHGGKDKIQLGSMNKTPRCAACGGKLLTECWRTPDGLKLPTHGRLLTRGRARSQGPDQRARVTRRGDSGEAGGAAL